jgi:Protein of unknown function (DUF2480)
VQAPIINKVEQSSIISFNLEELLPTNPIKIFDIKQYLFMELLLKEKDFRASLLAINFEEYNNCNVAVCCTADAIVPVWAYMLVASYLQPFANDVLFTTIENIEEQILLKNIDVLDIQEFVDKRVVIKGCGEKKIAPSAYLAITKKLRPIAKSIMYGEPCSTVPIYKKSAIKTVG